MQPSKWLFDFLKGYERFRPTAYDDGRGVWTIGWGHTRGVKKGDTCTMAQADAWLQQDVAEAVAAVNRLVKVPLTQNQFDALVSLVFNCGPDPLVKTLGHLLNAKDYAGAALQFLEWKNAGRMRGVLLPRRKQEMAHFNTI
jgi:lysozyme